MGTRHLTCVVVDDDFKVAQYGQWDGYPEGAGKTCCDFIQQNNMDEFKNKVSQVTEIDPEELDKLWVECGAEPNASWVNLTVSNKMRDEHYHLTRDCGADILQAIMDGATQVNYKDVGFAADSLFCEWAYVLDMDNSILEVYEGFVKEPHSLGRFANLPLDNSKGYYQIKLVAYIPFSQIKKLGFEALKNNLPEEEE